MWSTWFGISILEKFNNLILQLLDTSLEIADDLNMKVNADKIRELQNQIVELLKDADATTLTPVGLTAREMEVLELIAVGKTNRDIAKDLVITVPTAARHVSNIFSKIGVNNRTEAAAYATKHGLTESS